MGLPLVVQLCLTFGVAGLLWPDKFKPVFEVLMFPWTASYRSVRANSIAAIAFVCIALSHSDNSALLNHSVKPLLLRNRSSQKDGFCRFSLDQIRFGKDTKPL